MLWRMSADSRARKLGIMSRHRVRKVCGKRPSRLAAGRRQPVPQPLRGSGNCANCPTALSSRFPGPYYGAQELPVVERLSGAISCRVVSEAVRFAEGRSAIALAETAETAEINHPIRQHLAGNDSSAAAGHSLTLRSL